MLLLYTLFAVASADSTSDKLIELDEGWKIAIGVAAAVLGLMLFCIFRKLCGCYCGIWMLAATLVAVIVLIIIFVI